MTVGHVCMRHVLECIDPGTGIGDAPDRMPHLVCRHEVIQRLRRQHPSGQNLDFVPAPVGQEHRLGVRFERKHVPGAIVLLVLPSLLVLPNDVPLVIIHMNTAHQTGLSPAVHDLPIQIQRSRAIPNQDPLVYEAVERLTSQPVDARVVGIDLARKVDVGSPDMQEAVWVSLSQIGGLIPAYDIVGDSSHLRRQLRPGTKRVEGVELHGGVSLLG